MRLKIVLERYPYNTFYTRFFYLSDVHCLNLRNESNLGIDPLCYTRVVYVFYFLVKKLNLKVRYDHIHFMIFESNISKECQPYDHANGTQDPLLSIRRK